MPVAVKWHAGNDRGVARLDGAAARFIKRANAPWPRKFAGNGVEVIGVSTTAAAARGDREWRVLRIAEVMCRLFIGRTKRRSRRRTMRAIGLVLLSIAIMALLLTDADAK